MADIVEEAVELGDDQRLRDMLAQICATTGMGFAAVARVTDTRWIACQVLDRIDFGMDPGDELKIAETICDEIRDSGEAVVFDDASTDIKWSRHPVPVIYGFKATVPFQCTWTMAAFSGRCARSIPIGGRSRTKPSSRCSPNSRVRSGA